MSAARAQAPPISGEEIMARAGGENFPVASLLLPRRVRRDLLAVYGFARLVDQIGDDLEGDRGAALSWLEGEVDAAFRGRAEHPLMRTLSATIAERSLERGPLLRLIEANRMDQSVKRYESWEQLEGYCDLSANPVGELVLGVFGMATAERVALSDRICTALQLVEHCQDVAEDLRAGRVYLPGEDMRRFGCSEQDLWEASAGGAVRKVIAFQAGRAMALLAEGEPLIGMVGGGGRRIAVAAFVAGGRAAVDAMRRAEWDVLTGAPKATRVQRARALGRTLRRRKVAVA